MLRKFIRGLTSPLKIHRLLEPPVKSYLEYCAINDGTIVFVQRPLPETAAYVSIYPTILEAARVQDRSDHT